MNGNCPFCRAFLEKSPLWVVEDHLRIAPGLFAFHSCPGCGSVALDPVPTAEVLRDSYPERYMFRLAPDAGKRGLFGRLEMAAFYRRMFSQDARLLQEFLPKGRGRLLDVGTGEGQRAALLRDLGFDAEGLEVAPAAARSARERLHLTVHESSIAEHARENGAQYDVLTMFNVLEHVRDASEALSAARMLLKESGWLILKVPVRDGLSMSMFGKRHICVREAPRHVALPSVRGLKMLLKSNGFELARIQPSSLISRAGQIGLSIVPGGTYAAAAGHSPAGYAAIRGLAVLAGIFAGIPIGLLESLAGRPVSIMLAARAIA